MCPLAQIETELKKIVLPGWSISAEKVKRGALVATHVKVTAAETHHHRGYSMIADKIAAANLAPRAADRATRDFQAPWRGRSEGSRRAA